MTALKLIHIEEPLLEFRFGQKLVYPRDGLFLYGPVDGGRPEINYGVIGTPAGIARLERWTQSVAGLIPPPPPRPRAKLIEPQHIAFPGFQRHTIPCGPSSHVPSSPPLTATRFLMLCTLPTVTRPSRPPSIFMSPVSSPPQRVWKTRRPSGSS